MFTKAVFGCRCCSICGKVLGEITCKRKLGLIIQDLRESKQGINEPVAYTSTKRKGFVN